MSTTQELLKVVYETIIRTEFCFLITLDETGRPNARLMQPFISEYDLTIWFGADRNSRKIREIRNNNWIIVAFQDSNGPAYITLIGSANIEDSLEKRKKYWREDWLSFWPDGSESSDYMLIQFVPSQIELMHSMESVELKPAILIHNGDSWVID
jgi:general stress protein 26